MLQVYCRNFDLKNFYSRRSPPVTLDPRLFFQQLESLEPTITFPSQKLVLLSPLSFYLALTLTCITHWSIKQTALMSNVSFSYICSLMSGLDRRLSWNLRKPSRSDKYLRLKRINFIRKPQLRSTECGNQGDEPVSRSAVSMFASRLTLAFGITFSYLRSNAFLFLFSFWLTLMGLYLI